MIYFIAVLLLWKLEASSSWWVAFFVIIITELILIIYNSWIKFKAENKKPSILLKPNGQPYTEADLEFIWKHGYQSALEVINSTKQ